VDVERQRKRRINQRKHVGDCLADFTPIFPLLAPRDCGELVEHLHAELAAAHHQSACAVGLPAGLLAMDENVGVEESAQRWLASSRSKRSPCGNVQLRAAIRSNALRR
jgi:hypothetical protein